jgi:hypothetical protein
MSVLVSGTVAQYFFFRLKNAHKHLFTPFPNQLNDVREILLHERNEHDRLVVADNIKTPHCGDCGL